MRVASDLLDGEVTGSTWGDELDVDARYGTQRTIEGLKVTSGSFEWDAANAVQGTSRLTFVDEDGSLQPFGPTHPLNCYGSRLQVMVRSGASGVQVPLGPWRISGAEPKARYQVAPRGDSFEVRFGGGTVVVDSKEILHEASLRKMDGESPKEPTYLTEVKRLLFGIAPVVVDAGVADKLLPADLTYSESRINTVQDHIARVGAAYRIGPDGALQIVSRRGVGDPLKLSLGNLGNVLETSHSFSDVDIANIFVAEGRGPDRQPLIGRSSTIGALAPTSELGPIPRFKRSTEETQAGVDADAVKMRDDYAEAGEGVVEAVVLTNVAVQMQDRIEVPLLTVAGVIPVVGRAVKMRVTIADGVLSKSMRISAAVPMEKLEEVQYRIDHHV